MYKIALIVFIMGFILMDQAQFIMLITKKQVVLFYFWI